MRRDVVLIPLYLWVSASICVHIVSYFGTSEVAARAARDQARRAAIAARNAASLPFSLFEIVLFYQPPPPPPSTEAQASDEPVQPAVIDPQAARPPPPEQRQAARREPQQRAPRPTPPQPTPQQPTPPRPPTPPPTPAVAVPVRPPQMRMQHVDQQNNNNEPTPEDPAFLAQSNNNVREQTVAALRNLNRNEPSPQVGGAPQQNAGERQGNAAQDRSADSRDVTGDRRRVPESSPRPPERAPSTQQVANAAPGIGGASREGGAARAAGRIGRAGAVGDPGRAGALAMVRPAGAAENVLTAPQGAGALAMGAAGASAGQPSGAQGAGGEQGRNGQNGAGGDATAAARIGIRGLGAAGAIAALTPNATTYAQVFGAQAERERRVAQERRSQARGSYTESWRENRAAIENYTPGVRVGNNTALRTAQSPFSAYLTGMHRRIHRLFADGFIPDLERLGPTSPLNDMSLVTTVEVILERDGRVHRLGVVRTSGNIQFDVASLNSVRRAAPFGEAPAAILSGDGRVYLHWGFYRNERQCGTFNVDPYILPNPGQTPPAPRAPQPQRGPVPSDERAPMPGSRLGARETTPRG